MQKSVFDLNKKFLPKDKNSVKEVIILGSTGSVGSQALEICISNPEKFRVKALIAHKSIDDLIKQAVAVEPEYVVLSESEAAEKVKTALSSRKIKTKVLSGENAKKEVISEGCDIAITAIPGIQGLELTLEAIKYSKVLAFANKETIIYAGELMLELAEENKTCIIPIDSEHNAIFQILDGLEIEKIKKIILTASGGPLLNSELGEIKNASVQDVLKHPTWKMGRKISVDSATLFNKALEVMEASYLFGMRLDDIEVIIHPESIVHGMVRLHDGSLIMHAGARNMKLPISYALGWPNTGVFMEGLNLCDIGSLNFSAVDHQKFQIFQLAIDAAKRGVVQRITMNYANEVAVQMFLDGRIKFFEIYEFVKKAIDEVDGIAFELNTKEYCKSVQKICGYVEKLIFNHL